MGKLSLGVILLMSITPMFSLSAQCNQSSGYVPQGYTLKWSDEFNDSGANIPDSTRWYYQTGNHGWGNGELQNYIPAVVGSDTCALVSNGTLKIIARKRENQVVSVRMNTKENWTYGYFEGRLKLPQGKGTWPAFWMLAKDQKKWPLDGEIDVMEEVGYRPNYVSASIHCQTYNHAIGTQKTQEIFIETAESDFHVYAVEWTADYIYAYVDGKKYFEYYRSKKYNKKNWPFNVPFYLKLNLAWGGFWGGTEGVDESILPATYEIDYIRVYQK